MNKEEYFNEVVKVITELTDVSKESIVSSSREADVVDARWITIRLLKESGYSTKQIVPLIGHKRRTIDHAMMMLDDRIKYSYNGIGNILATARQLLFK